MVHLFSTDVVMEVIHWSGNGHGSFLVFSYVPHQERLWEQIFNLVSNSPSQITKLLLQYQFNSPGHYQASTINLMR